KTGLGTEGRARLLQEAQAIAKLNHPNIVTVYDAGETDELPFIVMEFVEGQTLHEKKPESLEGMLAIMSQVCAALEHAHASGIIHRDLKPENVTISPDGKAKLMDFGLARSVASRYTAEGTIVGTVFYLAPELALGHGIDHRADLYSLGVMLYELTTGELPFIDSDPVAVISQHLHAPVVPPRAKNPEIPPALNNLILSLLNKDPDDRPASAAEVGQLLEKPDILAEAPIPEELSLLDRIVRGRLVGRERELGEARALWNKAISDEGQTLLISGEPGIGKTRLMREVATHAEVSGGQAIVGECYAEGGAPYGTVGQIIRRAFQRSAEDGFNLPDFVMADLLMLSPSLKISYPDIPPNPPLDPQSEQQRLFESVVALCKVLSERAPLLLVVEDVHWADSGTLSLLRHLARRLRRERVLLLATYREVELDEARPFNQVLMDLNREQLAVRLKLPRLSREQTKEMLEVLFDEEMKPESLDAIYHETEGNPFFIEEVSKALVESGKLYFEDGRWHRPDIVEELEIPQSVRVAIQSRIGKLPEQVQETLQLASILGREFDFDTLAEASDLDEDALIEALENAEQDQLIEEVSTEDGVTFAFAHAMIPTTLVESVRTLRRRRIHRRAASAIERTRPEDYEALAYHNGEAGDHDKALKYYTLAGERAAKAYANQEAETYFRSALDMARTESDQAHLYVELGEVLFNQSRFEEAIEIWREGIKLYQGLEDKDRVAWLYARCGRAAWCNGDTPGGLTICQEGMATLEGAPDSTGMANLLQEIARAYFFNFMPNECRELCDRALEMAERVGAVDVQADTLATKGVLHDLSTEEAMKIIKQAIELAESAGLLFHAVRAHVNYAAIYSAHIGDISSAIKHLQQAAELCRRMGNKAMELFCACRVTNGNIDKGNLAEAEDQLAVLHDLLDATPDPGSSVIELKSVEGYLLYVRGELTEAAELAREVQRGARDAGDLQWLSGANVDLGMFLLEMGENEEAETALLEAVELLDKASWTGSSQPRSLLAMKHVQQSDFQEAHRWLDEAREKEAEQGSLFFDTFFRLIAERRLAVAERNWPEAWEAFEEFMRMVEKSGIRWYRARALREWGEAHLTRREPGDEERAQELLLESQTEFEEMGAPIYAAQVKEILSGLA
ncbi:MAG: hypothetical protein AMJ88_06020, partial [Anaerolineae bacterium SM23_ 63]